MFRMHGWDDSFSHTKELDKSWHENRGKRVILAIVKQPCHSCQNSCGFQEPDNTRDIASIFQVHTNSLLTMWRKSQCDKELNRREGSQTILSLYKVEKRFQESGCGHGNQLLFSENSNTDHNFEDTELDLTTATHQLKQLLGDKGSSEGSQASRCLP